MIAVDNPYPRERAPGVLRIAQRFQPTMLRVTGIVAIIAAIDHTQALRVDLTPNVLPEHGPLRRQGWLPGLEHLARGSWCSK